MEPKDSLDYIAYENGLDYVETTSAYNGYPSHIRGAIIGFSTFDEARALAEKHGLEIIMLDKRDGWQLWHRGSRTYEPIIPQEEWFGHNTGVTFYEKTTLEELIRYETYGCDPCDKDLIVAECNARWEYISKLDDDEIAVFDSDGYICTIKKECVYFHYDTKHTAIGVQYPD